MDIKINLKQLIGLFVRTAEKYKEQPLGAFAGKLAVLTAHVFQLTRRVIELDQVVATLVKQGQAAVAAPAPVPAPQAAAAPVAADAPSVEEEEDNDFNDIARETAAELASVSRPSAITSLRKLDEVVAQTAKEAS